MTRGLKAFEPGQTAPEDGQTLELQQVLPLLLHFQYNKKMKSWWFVPCFSQVKQTLQCLEKLSLQLTIWYLVHFPGH